MIPALQEAGNSRLVALASRDALRARHLAARHGISKVHATYEELIADPEIEAVYVPLANSLHRQWTECALAAGKHVLCEKPLAVDAGEAERMAAAALTADRLLMEALMYRFHPRMCDLASRLHGARIRHLYAAFGFPIQGQESYRLVAALGGGALLDVGCYLVDVARWLLGEPDAVTATAHENGVDMAWSMALAFPSGAQASLHASFESPEYQELVVVSDDSLDRVATPFTAWRDPHDPYRLMVEAFSAAVLDGSSPPLPISNSIANVRLLDRIRAAALK